MCNLHIISVILLFSFICTQQFKKDAKVNSERVWANELIDAIMLLLISVGCCCDFVSIKFMLALKKFQIDVF